MQWFPTSDKNHPPVSWLKMVWKNLYIHFSEDLSPFDDMPLIPKTLPDEDVVVVDLIRLRSPSPIILDDGSETQLPEFLPEIIEQLGGIILKKLDPSIQHPLLKKYIHAPFPHTVLQIAEKLPLQKLVSQVTSLPTSHKNALRSFLASLTDVTEKEKRVINELTIFRRIEQPLEDDAFTALKVCKVLHHNAKLPPDTKFSVSLVDSSDEATIRLVNILKAEQLKTLTA